MLLAYAAVIPTHWFADISDPRAPRVACCIAHAYAHSTHCAQVLPKYEEMLTARSYVAIIVALSRKERWALSESVLRWARSEGVDLRANAMLGIAGRRLQDGHVDRALQACCLLSGFLSSPHHLLQ